MDRGNFYTVFSMDAFCLTVKDHSDHMLQYIAPELTNLDYLLRAGRWRVEKVCNRVQDRCSVWLEEFSKTGTLNDMYAVELTLKRDGISLPVQIYMFVAFNLLAKYIGDDSRMDWCLSHVNMRWASNCHSSGGVFQQTAGILATETHPSEEPSYSESHVSQTHSQTASQYSLMGQTSQGPSPPLTVDDADRNVHTLSTDPVESQLIEDPPPGTIDVIRNDIDTQRLPEEPPWLPDESEPSEHPIDTGQLDELQSQG